MNKYRRKNNLNSLLWDEDAY